MIRSIAVISMLSLAISSTVGCGAASTYARRTAPPGRITWTYDNGLQARKAGRIVAEAGRFSGLSEAVACVPRARELADSATAVVTGGRVMLGIGLAVLLGGVGAGGAYMAVNDENLAAGAGIMVGTLVLGSVLALVGAFTARKGLPRALDAVNIYNDFYRYNPGCQRRAENLGPSSKPIGPRPSTLPSRLLLQQRNTPASLVGAALGRAIASSPGHSPLQMRVPAKR